MFKPLEEIVWYRHVVQIRTVEDVKHQFKYFQAIRVNVVAVDTLDGHCRRQTNCSMCKFSLISRSLWIDELACFME